MPEDRRGLGADQLGEQPFLLGRPAARPAAGRAGARAGARRGPAAGRRERLADLGEPGEQRARPRTRERRREPGPVHVRDHHQRLARVERPGPAPATARAGSIAPQRRAAASCGRRLAAAMPPPAHSPQATEVAGQAAGPPALGQRVQERVRRRVFPCPPLPQVAATEENSTNASRSRSRGQLVQVRRARRLGREHPGQPATVVSRVEHPVAALPRRA